MGTIVMDKLQKKDVTEESKSQIIKAGNKTTTAAKDEKIEAVEQKVLGQDDSLEIVLSDLKLSGRYHIKFLFMIGLLAMVSSAHSVNYVFAAESIDYRCRNTHCENFELSRLQANSTLDFKCHRYGLFNYNETCNQDNINQSNVMDCTEWIYDKPVSFVAEFDLGCEEWKRTLVGTMHSTGFMLGLLFIGPMSDKIGRKKLIIFNIVIAGLCGVLKSLATSYWLYIALEMIEPLLGECYATAFTLAIEMVTQSAAVILMLSVGNSMGQIILALTAYLTPNWRYLLLYLYAPCILFLLYILCLDESLRWLLIKGKKTEAEEIIRKAAEVNNIVIDESKLLNLKCEDNSTNASLVSTLKITLSSKKLFVRLLICFCAWFTSLFNTYSLVINSVSLEGNKYLNYALVSLAGTIAGLILFYLLTKFQRKGPLILALTLTGVFCVGQSFVSKELRWLSTSLYLCGVVTSVICIRILYLYTTELFPTYTRNTMLALCSAFGRTATILAPQTPLLRQYWAGLPSLLVGVMSLMTASVVTLLPDSSEDILPDNVTQAEAVGNKQRSKDAYF